MTTSEDLRKLLFTPEQMGYAFAIGDRLWLGWNSALEQAIRLLERDEADCGKLKRYVIKHRVIHGGYMVLEPLDEVATYKEACDCLKKYGTTETNELFVYDRIAMINVEKHNFI